MTLSSSAPAPSQPIAPEMRRAILVTLRKTAIVFVIFALALFLGAGRLDWPAGWIYFAAILFAQIATSVILFLVQPGLIVERSGIGAGVKRWDVLLSIFVALIGPALTMLVAGLDIRNGWSAEVPTVVQAVALVVMVAGYLFTTWAMARNPFFAPVVRIQQERGQSVVKAGPYRWMRHPGYLGAAVYILSTPLVLGSLWAFVPAALVALVDVVRTLLEDRVLRAELPGYADYAQQVRYRLVPGVW